MPASWHAHMIATLQRNCVHSDGAILVGRRGRQTPRDHYQLPGVPLRSLKPGRRFEHFVVRGHSWLEKSWLKAGPVAERASGAGR